MKKALSLILAIVMALGCMGLTAFAETPKNQTDITAIVPAKALSYEMVIPAATTLTEEAHENVLLGADGKVSITNVKNGTDKVSVYYTVDLTNGTLTDGTNTIAATYKYKQGEGEFAAIDGTTKVTVYENATVKDSLVNVTADDTQWKAAPAGTYNASVTFNFSAVPMVKVRVYSYYGEINGQYHASITKYYPVGTAYTVNDEVLTIGADTYTVVYSIYNPFIGWSSDIFSTTKSTSGTLGEADVEIEALCNQPT